MHTIFGNDDNDDSTQRRILAEESHNIPSVSTSNLRGAVGDLNFPTDGHRILTDSPIMGVVHGSLQNNVVATSGTYDSSSGYYRMGGTGRFIQWNLASNIQSGSDFVITSSVHTTFVIWDDLNGQSHFGFDGSGERYFSEGTQFGSLEFYGPSPSSNVWHDIEVRRSGNKLELRVDGVSQITVPADFAISAIGWRPHRSTVRVSSLTLSRVYACPAGSIASII